MSKSTINPLLPLVDPVMLTDKKTGEVTRIRYREGFPKTYQLNLAGIVGKLTVMNGDDLTKGGEDFAFIPLAYRYFEGELFGQPQKKWAEVYFLNQLGWVCQLMFAGHNAENLVNTFTDAEIYRDLELGQFGVKVRLNTRQVTLKDDTKANYYTCAFNYFELDDPQQLEMKAAFERITEPLFRSDIADPASKLLAAQNWNLRPAPAMTLAEEVEAELAA